MAAPRVYFMWRYPLHKLEMFVRVTGTLIQSWDVCLPTGRRSGLCIIWVKQTPPRQPGIQEGETI